jgi:tetratricopeptide (TPR) repeat protein
MMLQSDNWAIRDEGLQRLHDRGIALFTLLSGGLADGTRLEWGWEENRPALSTLSWRILDELDEPPSDDRIQRLEWMVLRLNPDDNFGFRNSLMQCYLARSRIDDALRLAERYPDDFAEMSYTRALVLFAAGRVDEAERALRAVVAEYPKPLTHLLAKRARRAPKRDGIGYIVGGDDEAWAYRKTYLPWWQSYGALEWARALHLLDDRSA